MSSALGVTAIPRVSIGESPRYDAAYLERVGGATVIVPLEGYTHHYLSPWHGSYAILHTVDKTGKLSIFPKTDESDEAVARTKTQSAILGLIDGLVGKKVIFYPMRSTLEVRNFAQLTSDENDIQYRNELPFDFQVRREVLVKRGEYDRAVYNGDIVGRVIAREYERFTREDAESIKRFVTSLFASAPSNEPAPHFLRQ